MKTNQASFVCFKHKAVNLLLLLFLFNAFASAASPQNNTGGAQINVRVTDPQGATLANAKVTLYTRDNRIRISSLTDSSGTSHFERLAPGQYLIEAEASGFARAATRVLRLERSGKASLDISLPLAGVSEQVVVTAQATAQPVDEVSKAVSVLDRQEIDERDESAIAESLRAVPGLRVQQLGGPGSF